uniref:Uncharacterized protein n=1 Tax=Helicotheca tamesis TaxID=374047 RepID=A0A7S2I2Y7_9STRA|mmetsp:Transcript_4977/g.6858  ORF Transcript_4977/g.6858 Transcript_4977/m.6858 type:complete len:232 (+) Transcript_4977:86-781(+)
MEEKKIKQTKEECPSSSNLQERAQYVQNRSSSAYSDAPSIAPSEVSFHERSKDSREVRPILGSFKVSGRTSPLRSMLTGLYPGQRFSSKSNVPWGSKPHPLLGLSCLSFALLVVPLSASFPQTAVLVAMTTVISFQSEYTYTGMTSVWHLADRITAPATFLSALNANYLVGGPIWTSTVVIPLSCFYLSNIARKTNNYESFVLWHSLWHFSATALLFLIFWSNNTDLSNAL